MRKLFLVALIASLTVSVHAATGTISFKSQSFQVNEADGVAHVGLMTTYSPVSVDYTTLDYTLDPQDYAHDGVRYHKVSGTLSFAAGETLKYVDVPLINDNDYNNAPHQGGGQPFGFPLSNATNGVAISGDGTAPVVIYDDDLRPLVDFAPIPATMSETSLPMTITLTRTVNIAGQLLPSGSWARGMAMSFIGPSTPAGRGKCSSRPAAQPQRSPSR